MSNRNDKILKLGWRIVKFGDVVTQVKDRVADAMTSGHTHYVRGEDFVPAQIQLGSRSDLSDEQHGPAFHMQFKKGDVLYVSRNPRLRKAAVANFDGICANTTYVCRSDTTLLLQELLPFIMQTEGFSEYAKRHQRGSTNVYVNWSDIAPYEFMLPPIEEQQRMVAVLQGYATALDALKNLEVSAKALYKSLLFDRAEAIRKNRSVALESVVADGRPITYGIVKPGLPFEGGIPVIKVRDFPDGVVLEDDLLLTSPEIEKDYKRSRLLPGDLLFSIRGTVGRMAFVPETLKGAQITQDTARLTIGPNFDPRYVRYMLESPNAVSQVKGNTMGLAVQGINLGELRKVTIPACELDQQVEFADELDEISQGIRSITYRKNDTLRQFAAARENVLMRVTDV